MRKPLRGAAIAWAVCLVQAGILLVAALLTAWLSGRAQVLAALYGGSASLVLTVYFAAQTLLRGEGKSPAQTLGAFYRGEAGKFVLTMALFVIGAKLFARDFLPLMLTFVACQFAYWPALGLLSHTR